MIELTIITAHYNNIEGLIKTYKSISSQTYKKWKFYIVDSFTPKIKNFIGKEILNDPRVKLYEVKSSIYDAMNFGILKASSKYIQILNSGTTYHSRFSLEKSMNIIEKLHIKNGVMLHFFNMQVMAKDKILYINKPSRFSHPLRCGHEAAIYPNRLKGKILHYHKYKIAADLGFIIDNSDRYKTVYHDFIFVDYPKGGYSDSKDKFFEKLLSHLIILKELLIRNKISASILLMTRILKDLIRNYFFK